jgi:four helix bundle protein
MRLYYFEKLDVWQKGRILIKEIYSVSNAFPAEEKFGMTSQIRRADISVNCNIAEGVSRQTGKDQARFTAIAYGSLMEVLNLLIAAEDLTILATSEVERIRPLIEELSNKLNALREAQLKHSKS